MTAARRLFALAPLALAACAAGGGGGITYNVAAPRGFATEIRSRLATDPVVSVLGRPADGASPEAVAAAMQVPGRFGRGAFRAVPPGSTESRLVIGFGTFSPEALCEGRDGSGGAGLVSAAWCFGPSPVASASHRGPAAQGPSDPGFATAMSGLLTAMLTVHTPPNSPR